ncbi:DoxX family protein [Streptomyces sp. NPDC058155]|uniref:DoxX family protein n=1 Tax=Streptomyces sp. NPDC058155 TaxID=3346359 RepID=UPI0036E3286D
MNIVLWVTSGLLAAAFPAPILVPLAATGLVVTMVGAMVVHARRGELPYLALNLALLVLAAVVAWGQFGPYAF